MTSDIDEVLKNVERALILRPGDIVVVEVDRHLTSEEAHQVKEIFAQHEVKAIVAGKGVRIAREEVHADAD